MTWFFFYKQTVNASYYHLVSLLTIDIVFIKNGITIHTTVQHKKEICQSRSIVIIIRFYLNLSIILLYNSLQEHKWCIHIRSPLYNTYIWFEMNTITSNISHHKPSQNNLFSYVFNWFNWTKMTSYQWFFFWYNTDFSPKKSYHKTVYIESYYTPVLNLYFHSYKNVFVCKFSMNSLKFFRKI